MPPICKESFAPFHIFTISFEISPRRAKCCYPLCHWSSLVIQVGKENEKSWNEIESSKCFWSIHSTKLTHSCQVLSSCSTIRSNRREGKNPIISHVLTKR